MENFLHGELSKIVLECFYKVYNTLGYGFLEKVYQKALFVELCRRGLKVTQGQSVKVYYEGEQVGYYVTDLVVEQKIILELKAGEGSVIEEHEAQLTNYLRATNLEVGYVLFFGKTPEQSRRIFENRFKKNFRTRV